MAGWVFERIDEECCSLGVLFVIEASCVACLVQCLMYGLELPVNREYLVKQGHRRSVAGATGFVAFTVSV